MQRQWRISQRESLQNVICRLTYLYSTESSQVVHLYLTFGTRARPLCLGLSASGERCVNLSQFSQYSN